MQYTFVRTLGTTLIAVAMSASPALAKGDSIFNGIVRHVSENNIKVYDPASKKTLGFGIAPQFKAVFQNGKQTKQLASIHPGQYVKVYYNRHLLGIATTDRILLLNQQNARIGKN